MSGAASQGKNQNQQEADDANVLRRHREQAFREVGFDSVAAKKAVNGHTSIKPSVETPNSRPPTSAAYAVQHPTI